MKRATFIVLSAALASGASHSVAAQASSNARQDARQCSADAQPQAERQAMEARFREIDRRQGRAAAMAYAQEQGRQFRERLIAEGVCTPDGRPRAQERADARSDRDMRQGSNCRLETRPVAGFGGAPMTMGMVTVCD